MMQLILGYAELQLLSQSKCLFFLGEILPPMVSIAGRLARKLYEHMRREAAAVKIQKNERRYFARKSYTTLRSSAIALQTGLRAMTARDEFRFRKRTKAAIIIQVSIFLLFHLFMKRRFVHPWQNSVSFIHVFTNCSVY